MTTETGWRLGATTEELRTSLEAYIGQNIDDCGVEMEASIEATDSVWRWMTPDIEVGAEYRTDRITINCDEAHLILSITIG